MQKTCNGCNGEQGAHVPYIVLEAERARAERTFHRMWVLVIVLVLLLVGTNVAWLWYESQFETVEETYQEVMQEADGNGNNVFVGGDMYGETNDQNYND